MKVGRLRQVKKGKGGCEEGSATAGEGWEGVRREAGWGYDRCLS